MRKIESLPEARYFGVPPGVHAWLPVEDELVLEMVKHALNKKYEVGQSSLTQAVLLERSAAEALASLAYTTALHSELSHDGPRQPVAAWLLQSQQEVIQNRLLANQKQSSPVTHAAFLRRPATETSTLPLYADALLDQSQDAMQHINQALTLARDAQRLEHSASLQPNPSSHSLGLLDAQQDWPSTSTVPCSLLRQPRDLVPLLQREGATRLPPIHPEVESLPNYQPQASMRDELAALWREIPKTYLDLLPLLQDPFGPTFTFECLGLLLQAQTLAETDHDLVRMGQIHTMVDTIRQNHHNHQLSPVEMQILEACLLRIRLAASFETPTPMLTTQRQGIAAASSNLVASLPSLQLRPDSQDESPRTSYSLSTAKEGAHGTLPAARGEKK